MWRQVPSRSSPSLTWWTPPPFRWSSSQATQIKLSSCMWCDVTFLPQSSSVPYSHNLCCTGRSTSCPCKGWWAGKRENLDDLHLGVKRCIELHSWVVGWWGWHLQCVMYWPGWAGCELVKLHKISCRGRYRVCAGEWQSVCNRDHDTTADSKGNVISNDKSDTTHSLSVNVINNQQHLALQQLSFIMHSRGSPISLLNSNLL